MIRSLLGVVLSMTETSVVLDVNGMGFELLCSRAALSLCVPKESARLTTFLQISEAGVFLFGFADDVEREMFLKITGIKGIGGRTAMTILSVLSVEDIVRAVSLADINTFMRSPGIGRKTAERLCFELKNSIPKDFALGLRTGGVALPSKVSDTVGDALRSLGFGQADVTTALAVVRAALGEDFDKQNEEALLKAALKELQSS
ncbi:Holliday junction ATP-dependent DNA helicase RuvA [Synergistales bacterium]|nr:Holliday junction ATP-dependent DNA helicase RuvA [Synergistales bacterium]